jgi:hypothetical protein
MGTMSEANKKPVEMSFDDAKRWAQSETHFVEVSSHQVSRSSIMKYAQQLAKDNPAVTIVLTQDPKDNSWIVLQPTAELRSVAP